MAVILTSQVEGKSPGDEYTGPNETWLLENGYAAAISEADIVDLDNITGTPYEGAEVEKNYDMIGSKQVYGPEFAEETNVQSVQGEKRRKQVQSTKKKYSSDPDPVEEEPEPEPDPAP